MSRPELASMEEGAAMDGFRHVFPIDVRFRDIDAMGHVNNAVFFTYLETARVAYVRGVGFFSRQSASGATTFRDPSGKGLILARISCQFKLPVYYGQRVEVGTRVLEMRNSSFLMEQRVEADGQLAALAEAVVVYYDYGAGESERIPDEIRARVDAFEAEGGA